MQYPVCSETETIDDICHRAYGATSGYVERVLQANPGLAELPEFLPVGTVIFLPEVKAQKVRRGVNLWD